MLFSARSRVDHNTMCGSNSGSLWVSGGRVGRVRRFSYKKDLLT